MMAKASEDDEITQKRYREKRTEHGHWKQSQQKRPGEKHPKQEYEQTSLGDGSFLGVGDGVKGAIASNLVGSFIS